MVRCLGETTFLGNCVTLLNSRIFLVFGIEIARNYTRKLILDVCFHAPMLFSTIQSLNNRMTDQLRVWNTICTYHDILLLLVQYSGIISMPTCQNHRKKLLENFIVVGVKSHCHSQFS